MLYESILYLTHQRNCLKFIPPLCHCLIRLLTISYRGNNSDFADNFKTIMSCCLGNAVFTWKIIFSEFLYCWHNYLHSISHKSPMEWSFWLHWYALLIMVLLEFCIFQAQALTEPPQLTGHFRSCLIPGTFCSCVFKDCVSTVFVQMTTTHTEVTN